MPRLPRQRSISAGADDEASEKEGWKFAVQTVEKVKAGGRWRFMASAAAL